VAITLLFHERERLRLTGNVPDVLSYELPSTLREQIIQIWGDILLRWQPFRNDPYGMTQAPWQNQQWDEILKLLCRSFAKPRLAQPESPQQQIETYFRNASVSEAWSVVEAVFSVAADNSSVEEEWKEAVADLNGRIQQHGVGYEFDGIEILRVDNRFIHSEVVKPALLLLSRDGFEGAEAEFLKGHEHYLQGRYKDAMNEALKAFESTMKCIAAIREIPLQPRWTASHLIGAMVEGEVLPERLLAHFSGLRGALESGVPTLRNQQSGHGQGPEVIEIPRHVAAHCLHLAAANIVFLVESHLAKE
jgi:AbiJ N-terminal domain 4